MKLWFTYKLGNFELSNTTLPEPCTTPIELWFTYKLGNFELSNTTDSSILWPSRSCDLLTN